MGRAESDSASSTCDSSLPRKPRQILDKIVYAFFKVFIPVSVHLEQGMAAYVFHRLSESPEQEVGKYALYASPLENGGSLGWRRAKRVECVARIAEFLFRNIELL